MNINVFANSYEWLFANTGRERAWSLGRFRKPIEPGDPIHFRWEGKIVGAATCSRQTAPGECDVEMHDGSRVLRGYKVHWKTETFEDLRSKPERVAAIESELRDVRRARARERRK